MIEVVQLTEELLRKAVAQEGMEELRKVVVPEVIQPLVNQKYSFAGILPDGYILWCSGVIEIWPDRGEIWAVFSPKCRKHWRETRELAMKYVRQIPIKRIEATVECSFLKGQSWLNMLGFKKEAPCLAQYREGRDYALYSYVKTGDN